jgi:hypothetical protein
MDPWAMLEFGNPTGTALAALTMPFVVIAGWAPATIAKTIHDKQIHISMQILSSHGT